MLKKLIVAGGLILAVGSASAGVAVMDAGGITALFVVAPGNGGEGVVARQNLTCTLNDGSMSKVPNEFTLAAGARMTCKPETALPDMEN